MTLGLNRPATSQSLDPPGGRIRFESFMTLRQIPSRDGSVESDRHADITVTVHVASHAVESSFFGDVEMPFENFDLEARPAFRPVWADKLCHQDRGLPRFVLSRITGTTRRVPAAMKIDARPRMLGKHIPADEIYIDTVHTGLSRLENQAEGSAMQNLFFRTRASHLEIELRILRHKC